MTTITDSFAVSPETELMALKQAALTMRPLPMERVIAAGLVTIVDDLLTLTDAGRDRLAVLRAEHRAARS